MWNNKRDINPGRKRYSQMVYSIDQTLLRIGSFITQAHMLVQHTQYKSIASICDAADSTTLDCSCVSHQLVWQPYSSKPE